MIYFLKIATKDIFFGAQNGNPTLTVNCFFVTDRPKEAADIAKKMLGKLLVTKQTGSDGKICNKVMVTTRQFPRKEFYMAVMMERSFGVRFEILVFDTCVCELWTECIRITPANAFNIYYSGTSRDRLDRRRC